VPGLRFQHHVDSRGSEFDWGVDCIRRGQATKKDAKAIVPAIHPRKVSRGSGSIRTMIRPNSNARRTKAIISRLKIIRRVDYGYEQR
jgi:hypothetical protein